MGVDDDKPTARKNTERPQSSSLMPTQSVIDSRLGIPGTGFVRKVDEQKMLGTPPRAEKQGLIVRGGAPNQSNKRPHTDTETPTEDSGEATISGSIASSASGNAPTARHSLPGHRDKKPSVRPPTPSLPPDEDTTKLLKIIKGDRILEMPEVTDDAMLCLDRVGMIFAYADTAADRLPDLTGYGRAVANWMAEDMPTEEVEAHRRWIWGEIQPKFPFESTTASWREKSVVDRYEQHQLITTGSHMSTNDGINLMKLLWRQPVVHYHHLLRMLSFVNGLDFWVGHRLLENLSYLDFEKRQARIGDYHAEDPHSLKHLRIKGHVLRRMLSALEFHILCSREEPEKLRKNLVSARTLAEKHLMKVLEEWKQLRRNNNES
ncbi:hypothetical protein QBC34DRAFT_470546 [Podospora aff. communis PSN243]|uniref:Uncharacterized protein n=1 Tax=Podospora aff. communis PSN243 TaxID=3040156 RepID=A0AAV9GD19_9PEZI|nr:hypothetical protein QBC34DRAFT_470546 [Podospora aff. communis PSN243]